MSISFSNPVVDFANLPELEDDQFVPVERAYFWMSLVMVAAVSGILVVALVGVSIADLGVSTTQIVGLGLLLAVSLIVAVVGQWLEAARMGYLLREHDFSFRRGVIRTSVSTIPFSRVQNVAIDRGLLVRIFGLANLRLHSAGGTLHVTGITYSSAESLKMFIVDQARIAANQEQAAR